MSRFVLITGALLVSIFTLLSIWLLYCDPSESSAAEMLAGYRVYIPFFCGAVALLLVLGARQPRFSNHCMLLAGGTLLVPLNWLGRMICGHESYGYIPLYWLLCAIIWGTLSFIHIGTRD